MSAQPTTPPARCAHEGRAMSRGMSAGVRMLRAALERGDLREAQRLIDWAERRAREGRRA